MDNNFVNEEKYMRAQKRIREIKGFYSHVVVTVLVIPFLIFINLRFSPFYHWFWYPAFGLGLSVLIHWFSVFGFSAIGLGKDWEKRKIKEMMDEDDELKY